MAEPPPTIENVAGEKSGKPLQGYGDDFSISVDWPLTEVWKDTAPEDLKKTGITKYKILTRNITPKYELWVKLPDTNTVSHKYSFTDEADNTHPLGRLHVGPGDGDYSVPYDSTQPKIVYISGN